MQVTNPPTLVLCKAHMTSCISFYKHPDTPKVLVKVGLTPPLCSHGGETAPPFIRSALKLGSCYVSWVPWYEVVNMKCGWHVEWQQWRELCEQVAQWIAEVSQVEAEVEEPVCLQPRNTTSEWNTLGAGDSWAVVLTEGRRRKKRLIEKHLLKPCFVFKGQTQLQEAPHFSSSTADAVRFIILIHECFCLFCFPSVCVSSVRG